MTLPTASPTPPSRPWRRWLELATWAVLAGVLLYRCVLPVPSASLSPELTSVRLAVGGHPTMVEFSASR